MASLRVASLRDLDVGLRGYTGSVVLLVNHCRDDWFDDHVAFGQEWSITHECAFVTARQPAAALQGHTDIVVAKVPSQALEEESMQELLPQIQSLAICLATDQETCALRCAHPALHHVALFGKALRAVAYDFAGSAGHLRTLVLTGCKALRQLPESMDQLTSLTTLDVSGCTSLTALPESIGRLSALTTLALNSCASLTELPEWVGQLAALTTLDIRHCHSVPQLPESVGQLANLKKLGFSDPKSSTGLPESMGQLTALTWLTCYSLTMLPAWVGHLQALQTLNLTFCGALTELPESIGQLTALTTLVLSSCKSLTRLPESVGRLNALTELYLFECSSLTGLPESLGQLTALTKLSLSCCSLLTALPGSMGQLAALATLHLNDCRALTVLPESIGQLTVLALLDLSSCGSLAGLPESMGRLAALEQLDLRYCGSLTALPESMNFLPRLTTIEVAAQVVSAQRIVFDLRYLSLENLRRCALTQVCIAGLLLDAGCPVSLEVVDALPDTFAHAFGFSQLPPEPMWLENVVSINWRRCILTGARIRALLEHAPQPSVPTTPTAIQLTRLFIKPTDAQAGADLARLIRAWSSASQLAVVSISSLLPLSDAAMADIFQAALMACPSLESFELMVPGVPLACFEKLALWYSHAPVSAQTRFSAVCKHFRVSNGSDVTISSIQELRSLLVPQLDVPVFFVGHSGAGKTQLQLAIHGVFASMWGPWGSVERANRGIRTLGANSMGRLLGRPDAITIGTSGTVDQPLQLGTVLEVGGQLEYRYLYRYLSSPLRLSIVVVRLDDPTHCQSN